MLRVVVSNFRASPAGVLRNKVPAFAKIAPIYPTSVLVNRGSWLDRDALLFPPVPVRPVLLDRFGHWS
jgi:hypothetical protein